jgi:hypothetical protein
MAVTKRKCPVNPVSPAASDAFDLFALKWQSRLNLMDWRIHRSPKPAGKANMAEITSIDSEARLASYRVGRDFGGTPVTAQSVEETACHEMLHVFFDPLIEAAQDRSVTAERLNGIEHALINTLVHLLVPQD